MGDRPPACAAPLVIPLFAGAAVLAIGGARKGVLRLAVCVLLFTFVGYSLAASVSYAVTRSQEAQVARALGMKTSCSGSDPELARRLNSLAAHNPANMLVETNWKVLQPLCTNRIPARAVATMALPEEFQRRIKLEPESEKALRDLWKVYTYRFDLQRAFPVTDTATPIKLLDFAKHNARSGTKYESDALRPHEVYFASLP